MYRKLVLWPCIGFGLLAALEASLCTRTCGAAGSPLPAWFQSMPTMTAGIFPVQGGLGLAINYFMGDLLLFGVGLGLVRAAVHDPQRRYPWWLSFLKVVAVAFTVLLMATVIYQKALTAASSAAVLALQTQKDPLFLLLGQASHTVPTVLGLCCVLTAPLFWAARGFQVMSLPRASFEAWVEVRRLLLPGVALLAVGAAMESFVTPMVLRWLIQ